MYKNYRELEMHNTTNLIEGGVFSPLKILIKIHQGLSKSLKLEIVDDYLINYKKKVMIQTPIFLIKPKTS
jgi:hypothetical protein